MLKINIEMNSNTYRKSFPMMRLYGEKTFKNGYAAILRVSRCKFVFDYDETVEILDLRINPEKMESTVDNIRYFSGYHMNKKHWFTICPDGTVSTEDVFTRIDNSYELAKK